MQSQSKINRVFLTILVAILFQSLVLCSAAAVEAESTSTINNNTLRCEHFGGWSHITTEYSAYLKQPLSFYQPQNALHLCDDNKPDINIVLVKKLIDWQQQHINGIELNVSTLFLTFKNIYGITFELGLNRDRSHLTTAEHMKAQAIAFLNQDKQAYDIITPEHENQLAIAVNGLIDNSAHIKVVFYGEYHADIAKPTMYAEFSLHRELTKSQTTERIDVSQQDISFYQSSYYQQTPINSAELDDYPIKGLLIMAESKNGKVLRHYFPHTQKQGNYPISGDVFNEVFVGIKNIQWQTND